MVHLVASVQLVWERHKLDKLGWLPLSSHHNGLSRPSAGDFPWRGFPPIDELTKQASHGSMALDGNCWEWKGRRV
jgi:hypothetical protein